MRYSKFISIALFLLFFIGCQPQPTIEPVNLASESKAIVTQLDKNYQAWKDRNVDVIKTLLTDDALFCGTDPGEFWNTKEYLEIATQMLGDETLIFDFTIDKREVLVGADGKSAIVVEQFIWNTISKKIPIRSVYNFVKISCI